MRKIQILKIYNNNIIAVLLDTDQIALVTGKGVGFSAKEDNFKLNETHQLFTLTELGKVDIQKIVDNVDINALEISRKIIEKFKENNSYPIMDSLLLQLSDHISFKVELLKENVEVPNLLMTEIKFFYPKEFSIGQYGVQLINEKYDSNFGDDEASYLALHILNSSVRGKGTDVYKITEFITEMVSIISKVLGKEILYNDWNYERLIVHLKFLAQRLLMDNSGNEEVTLNNTFFERSQSDLIRAKKIIKEANLLSKQLFGKELQNSEEIFLSIHILRIL